MKRTWYTFIICCLLTSFTACQNEDELGNSAMGYLRLGLEVNTSSISRAEAEAYNPKQLAVQILDANEEVVEETTNFDTEWKGETFTLPIGTYTIKASSAGFDGKTSGFDKPYYTGSTTVTIENEKTAKFKISSLTTNGLNVELGITFWTNCLYREAMFGLKQYFEIVGFMLRCKGFYMDNITFFQAYIQGKKLEQTDEEKDKENNKENNKESNEENNKENNEESNEENNKLLEAIPKIKDVLKDVYAPLLRNHHTTDRDLPYKHMNTFIAQLIFYILESSLIRTDYHEPLKEGWHIPEVKVTKNVCLFIYDILAANNCLYPEENNEDFKYRTIKPLLKNRRRLSN